MTCSNHCTQCMDSHYCNNCVQVERCVNSSYLTLCTDMAGSTYCLGCVGLENADFNILNEAYSRQEYFELEAKIFRALRIRR